MESATENEPPMVRKESGKGEKVRSAFRRKPEGAASARRPGGISRRVRAHRACGNAGGRENPIRSKTK